MPPYFAYGSNMWTPRLEHRVGPVHTLGIGRLDGFALRWHKRSTDGSGKCDVLASPEGRVWGVLYAVSAHQLQLLDEVEGVGHGYVRDASCAVSAADRVTTVSTYRAQPSHIDAALLPYDWYHALVLAGARLHSLPPSYVGTIAQHPALPDPDAGRAARERAFLDTISGA